VDSIVNPAFPQAEYERAKTTLPAWKFNLFYRGRFDKPAGLIYDSFDEHVCKIPRFNLNKDWPRYVGHDFGPNNTAAVWYAQDPGTGFLYLYRTYRSGGLSAFDHAAEFKKMSKDENIIRRVGGARHEEGWRESFLNAGWPILKPREHEVEVGINRVYGWHKSNKLFVFEDMKDYLDEKMSYSRELDDRYEATERIHNKSAFHLMDCLVAGTSIETSEGPRPIEQIQVGERVLTRRGYFPVKATTRKVSNTLSMTFSNGTALTGTRGHKVYVQGKGFVTMDSLRYCDIMEVCKPRSLPTKVSGIIGAQNLLVSQIGSTTEAGTSREILLGISTGLFGRIPMDQSLKTSVSIIKMVIHSIIDWITWSAKRPASMWQSIMPGVSMTSITSLAFGLSRSLGTSPPRAVSGMSNMDKGQWLTENFSQKSVATVERNSRARVGGLQTDSVPIDVSHLHEERVDEITRSVLARSATMSSTLINTPLQRHAPESAVRLLDVRQGSTTTVYDLNVDTVSEYYANGILVHNSERYVISDFSPESVMGSKTRQIYKVRPNDEYNPAALYRGRSGLK
jgi:hypothetical protein